MITVHIFYQNKPRVINSLSQPYRSKIQTQVTVFVESNHLFTPRFYYIFGRGI